MEGLKYDVLIQTTEKGNVYSAKDEELAKPRDLWRKFREGKAPVPIAMKAIGIFKSAFPDGVTVPIGPIPKQEGKTKQKIEVKAKKLNGLLESTTESAVIVFADVDFIHDRFAFKRNFFGMVAANENSTLFLNAMESLSGSTELMSVRSKGRYSRPFDAIENIEFQAEQKTAGKVSQIQASIKNFQNELAQMQGQVNRENIALIQSEGIKKRKDLTKKIALQKRELREVKKEGREKVESIGKFFQYINTLFVPLVLLFLGLLFNRKRQRKMQGVL